MIKLLFASSNWLHSKIWVKVKQALWASLYLLLLPALFSHGQAAQPAFPGCHHDWAGSSILLTWSFVTQSTSQTRAWQTMVKSWPEWNLCLQSFWISMGSPGNTSSPRIPDYQHSSSLGKQRLAKWRRWILQRNSQKCWLFVWVLQTHCVKDFYTKCLCWLIIWKFSGN